MGIPVICTENSGPPKVKDDGLIIVPTFNLLAAEKAVWVLISRKEKMKYPVVGKNLRNFISINAYSDRLISAIT